MIRTTPIDTPGTSGAYASARIEEYGSGGMGGGSGGTVGGDTPVTRPSPPPSTPPTSGGAPGSTIRPVSTTLVPRSPIFTIIQTFYISSDSVRNAAQVLITGVDLFFKNKPSLLRNSSGSTAPGVTVGICVVENGVPNLAKEYLQIARGTYDQIFAVSDASMSTAFAFSRPITVPTNQYYGIVIRFEDSNYDVWVNKKGYALVGTNNPSPGAGRDRDGHFFAGSAGAMNLTPQNDVDLKFRVKIAQFSTANNLQVDLVNNGYEFFTTDTRNGVFTGGEKLFVAQTQQTGTLNIQAGNIVVTGTGTALSSFAPSQQFIVQSGGRYVVSRVAAVTNSTQIVLTDPISFSNTAATFFVGPVAVLNRTSGVSGKLILTNSSANATVNFVGGSTIRGEQSNATSNIVSVDNLSVDEFVSHVNVVTNTPTAVIPTYNFAQANATAYFVDSVYQTLPQDTLVRTGAKPRFILSRSNELAQGYLYSTQRKSADIRAVISTTNPFISPTIENTTADITVRQMQISNTSSHLAAGVDTEVSLNGNALCKYFSRKMVFEQGRQAEDLRVYATAYRPLGTEIRMYARFYNAADREPFDDKPWTPLEIKGNKSQLRSSSVNLSNLIEFEYGLPVPESQETVVGSFTTTASSNILTAIGAPAFASKFVTGQLVKIYDPLFPQNYSISTVTTINSATSVSFTDPFVASANNLSVDILKYNVAFNYPSDSNYVRYYNIDGVVYKKYDAVQIKIVLQSDSTSVIPLVSQIQVIAVSA